MFQCLLNVLLMDLWGGLSQTLILNDVNNLYRPFYTEVWLCLLSRFLEANFLSGNVCASSILTYYWNGLQRGVPCSAPPPTCEIASFPPILQYSVLSGFWNVANLEVTKWCSILISTCLFMGNIWQTFSCLSSILVSSHGVSVTISF